MALTIIYDDRALDVIRRRITSEIKRTNLKGDSLELWALSTHSLRSLDARLCTPTFPSPVIVHVVVASGSGSRRSKKGLKELLPYMACKCRFCLLRADGQVRRYDRECLGKGYFSFSFQLRPFSAPVAP